jgi:hypothetical protein
MKIVYAREFAKEFKKLPVGVQRLYRKQEDIFKENWRDPRLKVKKLKDHPLPFSLESLALIASSSYSSTQIPCCLLLSVTGKMFTINECLGDDKIARL